MSNGGGKRYKKSKNLKNPLKNPQIHSEFLHKFQFKNFKSFQNSRGAILIEFAVCIPILIILIGYAHDLSRLKHLQEKMKFASTEMTNILQNISQNRSNKAITIQDLKYAMAASFLSWCPGRTLYSETNSYFMGCQPICIVYYFYGTEKNTATCKWYCRLEHWGSSPANISIVTNSGIWWERSVDYLQNEATKIHPSLHIEKGEYKIIIESFAFYSRNNRKLDNSQNISPKNSFSFYLITPKYYSGSYTSISCSNGYSNNLNKYGTGDNIASGGFFNSVIIFTPKPGLFSETPPQ